jgi:hypothetical protein
MPNDKAHSIVKKPPNIAIEERAFLRLCFFSSIKKATGTSMIETNDVIAAKNTNKKNKVATTLAPIKPIEACRAKNILGNNTNMRLTDELLSSAGFTSGSNEKIAGKISKPAIKATQLSASAINLQNPQYLFY